MIALILIAFLFIILISWIMLLSDSKKLKLPGPCPLPIVGNGLLFLGDSSHFLNCIMKLLEYYGGVAVRIYLFTNRYILISHPKYIEPLFSSTELIVKGTSYRFLKPWLGQGLLTSSGQRWRSHRKFLTPAFHFNILQNFLPVFCKNGTILTNKLAKMADGSPVNLFPIIALTALDNVTESIMGVSVNAQKDSESKYVKAIEELTEIIALRMRNPFIAEEVFFKMLAYKKRQDKALAVLHGQSMKVIEARRDELKRQDKALAVLHGQSMKVIEARRDELKRNNITSLPLQSEFGIKNKQAFLDLLLLSEIDGVKIDDEHIREEVDTFMFEGHDTTTSGIVFCLYCISKHEDVQNKILKELQEILGDDLDRDPSYTDLQQMKYLELVIKESLRLYPSVPMVERLVTRDTVIGDINVPKNTSIVVGILQVQRHPEMFKDPLSFIPERFENSTSKNPFSWIPFSAGPRNCIGQKFAMMEMKVTLSAVVSRFKLIPSGIEPVLCADLILRSMNGVHVGFKPRTSI